MVEIEFKNNPCPVCGKNVVNFGELTHDCEVIDIG